MTTEGDPPPVSLRGVSWTVSLGAFLAYGIHKGAPYEPPTSILDGTFLWICLGFLLLPFVRTLKIAKLFELEREVEKTKETVREVRDDVRQSLSILAAGLSASASARATVNNYLSGVQGQEAHPGPSKPSADMPHSVAEPRIVNAAPELSKPSSDMARSAAEFRILNTLWLFQVHKFPDLMPRFTFRITGSAADTAVFTQAAQKLIFEGVIGQNQDLQVFLTDTGLKYCAENYRNFPADMYFENERPLLSRENLDRALAKISR